MSNPMIIIESVYKTYYVKTRLEPVRALDNVSNHIDHGEVVAIIGPSGSGKSTLLRSLNGSQKIDSGSILMDGVDITAQLYIIFFVLTSLDIQWLKFDGYTAAIVLLSLYTSTYVTESVASAIVAVPIEQAEVAAFNQHEQSTVSSLCGNPASVEADDFAYAWRYHIYLSFGGTVLFLLLLPGVTFFQMGGNLVRIGG